MKIAFHSNTLGLRGSEQAVWDYASLNESILGNQSWICFPRRADMEQQPVFPRWKARFPLVPYYDLRDLQKKLTREGVEVLYWIKPGPYDGKLIPGVKNCVHAMFLTDEFHGDAFAYVSRWCSKVMTGEQLSYVPHLVPQLQSSQSLRPQLKIPESARVFGRHGAADTFNIPFVRQMVLKHARANPQDHFVFLNTQPIQGTGNLPNVHYLPPTSCPEDKARFLATCDAMLHARWHGETFGLAVGEFAVMHKPVFTYGGSREKAHLDALGAEARIYHDPADLHRLLEAFEPGPAGQTLYSRYSQADWVMKMFQDVFLESPRRPPNSGEIAFAGSGRHGLGDV